jgi:hypothetical protein
MPCPVVADRQHRVARSRFASAQPGLTRRRAPLSTVLPALRTLLPNVARPELDQKVELDERLMIWRGPLPPSVRPERPASLAAWPADKGIDGTATPGR